MALSTPQQSAGILSFYDAPEKGPRINAKIILLIISMFTIAVIAIDRLSPFLHLSS